MLFWMRAEIIAYCPGCLGRVPYYTFLGVVGPSRGTCKPQRTPLLPGTQNIPVRQQDPGPPLVVGVARASSTWRSNLLFKSELDSRALDPFVQLALYVAVANTPYSLVVTEQ